MRFVSKVKFFDLKNIGRVSLRAWRQARVIGEEWALGLRVGDRSRSRRRETLQGAWTIEQFPYERNGFCERPIGKAGSVEPLAGPFEVAWRVEGIPVAVELLLELIVVDEVRPCDREEAEAEDKEALV